MKRSLLILLVMILFPGYSWNQNKVKDIPRVPEWSKTAVWYQIFPERFANGDVTNDPTPHDMAGAWPYNIPKGWQISPWTSDWYKLQPWEKSNGHDFYWNAGVRRYGGDLKGVIDHLNYLKNLGITAIYFNPIFESPSLHKYDTRMYHHVDNNFGPNPKEDEKIWESENPGDPSTWKFTSADSLFLDLLNRAHKLGIKVLIDGVFNHVGTSFWAFQDVVKNQQKSQYKDWFKIKSWDDPKTTNKEFEYEGWNGVRDLPEIKKDPEIGIEPGFAKHVHQIVKRWMDPNNDGDPSDGIDGWRLDVAEKVDIKFWKIFRTWVKEINPEAYTTGEIWWEDWNNNVIFDASPWLQGDSFDGIMNYKFARAVKKFVIDQKEKISAGAFADSIMILKKTYPAGNYYALQSLMDSHDVDRIESQIVNPDRWYDHNANPGQNKDYTPRKPNEKEMRKHYLIAGLQMTLPGAPMIYYGDEAGMWGGDDPDCRKPMVWPGVNYETETTDPRGIARISDPVSFDQKLFNWYQRLIRLRNQNKALSIGDLEFFLIDNMNSVVGYKRTLGQENFFVVVNNSEKEIICQLDLNKFISADKSLYNFIHNKLVHEQDGKYTIKLEPYRIAILK